MKRLNLLLLPLIIFCSCVGKTSGSHSEKATRSNGDTITAPAKPESVTFALTGDMMLGTDYPEESRGAYLPVDSGRHLLDDCRDIFRRVDFACGNLEGVLGHAGQPKPCYNPSLCFTFRMPEYLVNPLVDAGFDYMNLANNHAGDFGSGGTQSSYEVLKKAGISSGGITKLAPCAIVERNGVKVGFTGFTTLEEFCPSVHDYSQLRQLIDSLKPQCDIIVVAMHAGAEGSAYTHVPRKKEIFHGWPRGNVYEFAHKAIDMGADIVWGHGPHVLRGAELYKDRLILYSLGNFCTPLRMGIAGATGEAAVAEVCVGIDGKFQEGKIHSYIQQRGRGPVADPKSTSARRIKSLSETDFPESPLRISYDGNLTVDSKNK